MRFLERVFTREGFTNDFRKLEADNDELARRATATGRIFVATTRLAGESVIRLAIGNAWTTEEDVRVAWEVLRECVP